MRPAASVPAPIMEKLAGNILSWQLNMESGKLRRVRPTGREGGAGSGGGEGSRARASYRSVFATIRNRARASAPTPAMSKYMLL